ncbi:MAG: DUF4230 domain-containing protein, partial [Solobacterium sp.]|nr:DUF4230 domain-containing protein [Solobacterium sp.]
MTQEEEVNKVVDITQKGARQIYRKHGSAGVLICVLLILALIGSSLWFWRLMIDVGAKSAKNAFLNSYRESSANSHEEYYSKGYETALNNYHISDDVTISLGEIREISKLEVLKVVKDDYVIETDTQRMQGIHCWTQYRGIGTFTVNLQASEFIVDSQEHYVLVHIPEPEMSFHLDEEFTKVALYMDGTINIPYINVSLNDGSYKEGVAIAEEQQKRAYENIRNSILNNQQYYLDAKNAAEEQIINLIKTLNSTEELSD